MSLLHLKTWIIEEFFPLLLIGFNLIMLLSAYYVPLLIAFTCYKWNISIYFWITYYLWIWYDMRTLKTEGRKINWLINLPIFKHMCKYYPCRLIKTADIPPNKNYMFSCFPHGLFPTGPPCNFLFNGNNVTKVFPGIDFRVGTLNAMFICPIAREYLMAYGSCTVDQDNLTYLLNYTGTPSKGVIVFPEGIKGLLITRPGAQYVLVKNNRKGFIRIALKTGAPLVPVFTFGEQNLWHQEDFKSPVMIWLVNIFHKLTRVRMNRVKGRGLFGMFPHRRPVTTVVGEPLLVPKVENPSSSLIDEYHEKFFEALKDLFEKYKGKYDEAGDAATWNTI